MAITSYMDFVNNYLTKNGMLGNATNINRAPDQLKLEIDELKLEIDELNQTKVSYEDLGNITPGSTINKPVNKPVIISPANLTVDYMGGVTSTYSTSSDYDGLQTRVIWECALDANFTNIIDRYEGSNNLISWVPTIAGAKTKVFVRTKQFSDVLVSEYSDVISFTTPSIFVEAPTIGISGDLSKLVLTPTINLSAFRVFNGSDTHVSTDYRVVNKATGVVKWQSLGNTVDKLRVTTGQLDGNTNYIFKARFNGQTYGSSPWVEVEGKTVNIYVNTPTLTISGDPNNLPEKPMLTGSAFTVSNGSDAHISTDWVIEANGVVVWSSLGSTLNDLVLTVPAGILVEGTSYTFKVKYNSRTFGSSAFGTVTRSTKSEFFNFNTDFGEYLEGGYYAGRITRAGGTYALIVAPRAQGQATTTLAWKNAQTTSGGCKSLNDGAANTAYMVANGTASVYPAAHFCNNLVINGFSDWYLPARDELEIAYRNLKPTTGANLTGGRAGRSSYVYTLNNDVSGDTIGVNRHSVPAEAAYTTSVPARTSNALFQDGGSLSFGGSPDTVNNRHRHWSSTEFGSNNSWYQNFSGDLAGSQTGVFMTTALAVRAFRAIKIN